MVKRCACLFLLAAIAIMSSSCTVTTAVSKSLPMERRTECEDSCKKLELEFAAMVLMMDHAGCVCQVPAKAAVSDEGGGLGAGASTITAVQAAQAAAQAAQIAAQQQQQRRQQQQVHY